VGYAKPGTSMTNLDNFGYNPTQQDIQPIQPNPEKATAQGAPSPLKLQPRREQRWDLHDGCIRAIISWSPHGRFLVGVGVRKSKTQRARICQNRGERFLCLFLLGRKVVGFGWSINLSVRKKPFFFVFDIASTIFDPLWLCQKYLNDRRKLVTNQETSSPTPQ